MITILNTREPMARTAKKSSIVFVGLGTKLGMPKLAPSSALNIGLPANNASAGTAMKEMTGKLAYYNLPFIRNMTTVIFNLREH